MGVWGCRQSPRGFSSVFVGCTKGVLIFGNKGSFKDYCTARVPESRGVLGVSVKHDVAVPQTPVSSLSGSPWDPVRSATSFLGS